MPELTDEEVFNGIDFPHNKWRKLTDKPPIVSLHKLHVLGYIAKLRKLQLPVEDIKEMLATLYWDAFIEHELQVKESTGKSVKEFFFNKLKEEALTAPLA